MASQIRPSVASRFSSPCRRCLPRKSFHLQYYMSLDLLKFSPNRKLSIYINEGRTKMKNISIANMTAQGPASCWIAMTFRSSLRLAPAPASSLSHSSLTFVRPHSPFVAYTPKPHDHNLCVITSRLGLSYCPYVFWFAFICRPHWPAYCLDHVYRRNERRGRKILTVLSPAHSLR